MKETKNVQKARSKLTQLCESAAPSRRILRAVERLRRRIEVSERRERVDAQPEPKAPSVGEREG